VVGSVVMLMSLPLLTLGFMIAGQSALLDGPVHPRQFIEPLRTDAARRRTLLKLCLGYGIAIVTVLLLAHWVSDRAWERLDALGPRADNAQLEALMPGLVRATLLMCTGGLLVSVPFWHAPALVYWQGQSVGQALFSSTLAVWRSKGAFFVYGMAWLGVILGFGAVAALLFGLLGLGQLASVLALPAGLMFSTVFYISLLFTFNDSFGAAGTDGGVGPDVDAAAAP